MLRYKKDQKYLVFDYETNGLNLLGYQTDPWQLSYLVIHGDRVVKESDNYLWWDNFKIDDRIAKMNHFDWTVYKKNARDPKEVHNEFNELFYDPEYIPLGHNVLGFDVYMHNVVQKRIGLKSDFSYLSRLIDTLCLARAIKKGLKKNDQSDLLSWQYRLLSIREKGLKCKLIDCLDDGKIEYDKDQLHNALYDIRMNFEVFKKQLWQIEI